MGGDQTTNSSYFYAANSTASVGGAQAVGAYVSLQSSSSLSVTKDQTVKTYLAVNSSSLTVDGDQSVGTYIMAINGSAPP